MTLRRAHSETSPPFLANALALRPWHARLMDSLSEIVEVRWGALKVPMLEPFGIASGAQTVADNVWVEVVLRDGTVGLGEAAPFPAVNGETSSQVIEALPVVAGLWIGQPARDYRRLSAIAREALSMAGACGVPSALCAVEVALLDALTKHARLPLWSFWGGAGQQLERDITLPTGDEARARDGARRARAAGFKTVKIKVGGIDLDTEARRVRAVWKEAPQLSIILDANAAYSAGEAVALLKAVGGARDRIVLFEQPTATEDWQGLAEVETLGALPVAADESARSVPDVVGLIRQGGVSVINIKITKAGLLEAWDMVVTAQAAGLDLMVGGMVETEITMTTSACLAAGRGGVRYIDLDTTLFLGPRPLSGGFAEAGRLLDLTPIPAGHGVHRQPTNPSPVEPQHR